MSTTEDIKCKLLLHLLLTNDEALAITNELESLQKALQSAQQRVERLEAALRKQIDLPIYSEWKYRGIATEALENENPQQ